MLTGGLGSFRLGALATPSGEGGDRTLASLEVYAGDRVWVRLCLPGGYFKEREPLRRGDFVGSEPCLRGGVVRRRLGDLFF